MGSGGRRGKIKYEGRGELNIGTRTVNPVQDDGLDLSF